MLGKPVERGRVWIIEDSPLDAEVVRRTLAGSHDGEIFTDGALALERLASGALPDALVLDSQLPVVTGLDVCRAVRAAHDERSLPILMLTAEGNKREVVAALAAGANDYVVKPFNVAEISARVGILVRTSRLRRAQIQRAQQLALSADVGEAITKGNTLEEVAKLCTEAIAANLDAPSAEVWTRREGRLELLASTAVPGSSIPKQVVEDVAERRRPVVIDDPAAVAALGVCGPAAMGFAALPLVVRDDMHGVVAFCSRGPIRDALHVLTMIADLLALGMARARADEERVLLLERERNTRAEAEAANRSKDEFLAMVSHELRTPLNAITGWTSMLLGGTLDAARTRRALETIDRNARSQAQLIDDLLDISRIISGKLRVNVGTVDVPSIAELALDAVRLAADGKGVTLEPQVDAGAGPITGDADRVQQIIWNLLTNAIKFTPRGGRVALRVCRGERGIEITVEDSGQGIAPEFLPYVFDRFKQADGTITRAKGGLGLGLAIVKHLVELHGGTIEVQSAGLGRGATFAVTLPIRGDVTHPAGSSSTLAAARAPIDPPRAVEGLRILVVDDEPDTLDLIRTLLESCKIVVKTASNAEDAFALVKTGRIDALVSDIAMPAEDGLSFIRRVRGLSREEGGRTPAVALTAYARLEDRTKALRAGFNSHIAKPVEPAELLAVLASLATR